MAEKDLAESSGKKDVDAKGVSGGEDEAADAVKDEDKKDEGVAKDAEDDEAEFASKEEAEAEDASSEQKTEAVREDNKEDVKPLKFPPRW